MTHFCVGRPTGRAGGGMGWGNRNAQVQKTQAKRAFFELVHCLTPKRPGSPALTGFPEPPALIDPKIFGSGAGGLGRGGEVQGVWGRNAPKVQGERDGAERPLAPI